MAENIKSNFATSLQTELNWARTNNILKIEWNMFCTRIATNAKNKCSFHIFLSSSYAKHHHTPYRHHCGEMAFSFFTYDLVVRIFVSFCFFHLLKSEPFSMLNQRCNAVCGSNWFTQIFIFTIFSTMNEWTQKKEN